MESYNYTKKFLTYSLTSLILTSLLETRRKDKILKVLLFIESTISIEYEFKDTFIIYG